MSERKLFVLVNPFAGKKKISKTLETLKGYYTSKKIAFQISDTSNSSGVGESVKAFDESFSDLIIVGGDGTINEAVNNITFDRPVSIIPVGTGNDFVKNLTIGNSLEEYLKTSVEGSVTQIDLGKCNDRLFVNGVGIGFDGQIVEDMIAKRVPLLRGHAAYYYHVLRILGSYRARQFRFQIEESTSEKDLILLTIGNGTTFGGGFKLMPEARLDDGLFEVCEVGNLSPIRRFLNIHLLSKGTHGKLKKVAFHRVQQLQVEENENLFAHIDGERMGQPPFSINVLPKALKIRQTSALL